MNEKRVLFFLTSGFFIILLMLAFYLPGTADSGDSIFHFLYAKYAFNHPENFLDPWAKPLYVLLASPFAQFGFIGIKIFNVVNSTLALVATFLIAEKLELKNRWLLPVIMLLAPMNVIATLSGLTEPLFACILSWGIFLILTSKKNYGILLFSFLPFVRSEGFFLLPVVALYLLWTDRWRKIIYLITGTVIYSVIGYLHYKDLFWVFDKNPYSLKSQYGTGPWYWFFVKMPSIIGLPLTILLIAGLIAVIIIVIKNISLNKINDSTPTTQLTFILVLFLTYFSFHAIAWTFGLFSSYGLLRVMIGVMPLIALIILVGYNAIMQLPEKKLGILAHIVLVPVLIFCTFLNVPNVIYLPEWKWPLKLFADQRYDQDIALYIRQNYPDYKKHLFYYSATYLSVALDQDFFDSRQHLWITNVTDPNAYVPRGSFVIWDDWYARTESLLSLSEINNDTDFQMIKSFTEPDMWGNPRIAVLFIKK